MLHNSREKNSNSVGCYYIYTIEIFCVYLGVFTSDSGTYGPAAFDANDLTGDVGCRRHAEE
jgi:hypothetical protein